MTPPKPYVVINMAASADGKISTADRIKVRFGSRSDRSRLELLRAHSDGVMIGATTLETDDPPLLIRQEEARSARQKLKKGDTHPLNIVVARRIDRSWVDYEFFHHPDTRRILFLPGPAPDADTEFLTDRVSVEVCKVSALPSGWCDLEEVIAVLREKWDCRTLAVEGGGTLNFLALSGGIVDEIRLTISPFVIGGKTAPTAVDGSGFPLPGILPLELVSCDRDDSGDIFLVYRVRKEPIQANPSKIFSKGWVIKRHDQE